MRANDSRPTSRTCGERRGELLQLLKHGERPVAREGGAVSDAAADGVEEEEGRGW